MEFADRREVICERCAWLRITGVPLIACEEQNFASIASNFGKILEIGYSFWNCMDASSVKVCILSASRKKINEEI